MCAQQFRTFDLGSVGVDQNERRRRRADWLTKEDIEPWRSATCVTDITQIPTVAARPAA
jgi:hypothetical protein